MLNPRSVAVVGATKSPGYASRMLSSLRGGRAELTIYPVNPKYDELDGLRCYPTLRDLPEAPDVVAVVVPQPLVADAIAQAGELGTTAAVVISAGYAERGDDDGPHREAALAELARRSGVRICGPNCLGVSNVKDGIWVAGAPVPQTRKGRVGLISQSGALGFGTLIPRAFAAGVGFSYVVTTGNQADIEFSDYARYLVEDDSTSVIAGYVEGFRNPEAFAEVARLAADRGKPIVLLKIGRAEAGARAARSHTAALSGSDSAYDALFRQYGVIRVSDYEELLEQALLLSTVRRPVARGVGVLSHSGGLGTVVADTLGAEGLALPQLSDQARDGIQGVIGNLGWAANPADVTRFATQPTSFATIAGHLLAEPSIGTLIVAGQATEELARGCIEQEKATGKQIVYLWSDAVRGQEPGIDVLRDGGIPVVVSPARLARGLRTTWDHHDWLDTWRRRAADAAPPPPPAEALAALHGLQPGAAMSERESRSLLERWGIPGVTEVAVSDAEGAVAAAWQIGFPVVAKIDSPDIAHKSESGLVRLGLQDDDDVRAAVEELEAAAADAHPDSRINGILIQEMVRGAVEVIAGLSHDEQLGPVLLFGTGGVTVEVFSDVARRICPITTDDALEMIAETRGARLLNGFRGRPPADVEALAQALVSLSLFGHHARDVIAEVDVNPLMILPRGQGVRAADALVIGR
ncbi:acetate--CoA ligase family protein [Blastococcus sp. URHD0036]|uniref:acetate--CoA ligase family protein n=1 Tax=Blastococcus sp. URHD0036 TaxID=1380356 RepID=UPI0018CC0049|nr:acetate--CoA ligase [Blastococcus sp. URHD0036]